MGLRLKWLVISSAHNLITVIQTVRRKLHTTLNNICTVLTSTRIEPELSESLNIQFVMSTFPLKKLDFFYTLNIFIQRKIAGEPYKLEEIYGLYDR
jgi:hypothetical protein